MDGEHALAVERHVARRLRARPGRIDLAALVDVRLEVHAVRDRERQRLHGARRRHRGDLYLGQRGPGLRALDEHVDLRHEAPVAPARGDLQGERRQRDAVDRPGVSRLDLRLEVERQRQREDRRERRRNAGALDGLRRDGLIDIEIGDAATRDRREHDQQAHRGIRHGASICRVAAAERRRPARIRPTDPTEPSHGRDRAPGRRTGTRDLESQRRIPSATMADRPAQRWWWLAPAIVYGAALVAFLAWSPDNRGQFPLDDAWIHRVYARSFAWGHGFAYN